DAVLGRRQPRVLEEKTSWALPPRLGPSRCRSRRLWSVRWIHALPPGASSVHDLGRLGHRHYTFPEHALVRTQHAGPPTDLAVLRGAQRGGGGVRPRAPHAELATWLRRRL